MTEITKMTRILVPLDDSPFSRKILPQVMALFPPDRCEVILFRAATAPPVTLLPEYELPPMLLRPGGAADLFAPPAVDAVGGRQRPIYEPEQWQVFEELLKRELDDDRQQLREAGYQVQVAVHFGHDPATEITRFAEREGVSVVAMATHGRTGLGRLLRGSVAERVLHHLTIPVLLLRARDEG